MPKHKLKALLSTALDDGGDDVHEVRFDALLRATDSFAQNKTDNIPGSEGDERQSDADVSRSCIWTQPRPAAGQRQLYPSGSEHRGASRAHLELLRDFGHAKTSQNLG
jgi:hypothetical protein